MVESGTSDFGSPERRYCRLHSNGRQADFAAHLVRRNSRRPNGGSLMRPLSYRRACLIKRGACLGLILATALVLAGCFASNDPLIAANASDHPLVAGAKFTEAVNCATAKLGCDSQAGYRPIASGSISIERGQYVLDYDPGSNVAFSVPTARGANGSGALFKSIGQDLYIVQLDGGSFDATAGQDTPPRYFYELVRKEGDYLYIYQYGCEENGDLQYVKSGLLQSIRSSLGGAICQTSDLRGLAAVFRARLANGLPPSERLELKPDVSPKP